jgi:hypothetical protein
MSPEARPPSGFFVKKKPPFRTSFRGTLTMAPLKKSVCENLLCRSKVDPNEG